MKRIKQLIASVLCATCTGSLWAQEIAPIKPGGFISGSYRAPTIPSSRLANTRRLASLIRGNRLYLTAQDAIALALENNIDVESNRYNALISSYSLLRAQAGGPLPGVPSGSSQVGSVSSGVGVAGSQAAAGVSTSGGSSNSGNSNTTISQIGPQTPSLDPSFSDVQSYSHTSSPQYLQTQSQTNNLIDNTRIYTETYKQGFITGGQATVTYNDFYLNENAPSDLLNPVSKPSLTLQVQQNFLQGFGVAVNSRNITIAKANLKITDLNFKQQVITVVVSVLNEYYSLSADFEDIKAKQAALDVARRFYEDNKKQVQIGTLAPLDVTSAEAQVASSELALVNSQTTLEQEQVTLKNLISRNGLADPLLSAVDIIPLDHISVPEKDDLPAMKDLVASAINNRPDLASTKLNFINSQTSALGTKNGLLPQLAGFASAGDSGLAGTARTVVASGASGLGGSGTTLPVGFIPCPASVGPPGSICEVPDPSLVGGIGKGLSQVFERHFPSESAGAFFAANLKNNTAQADATIDQLSLRQIELENQRTFNQVHVDVSNQYIGLQQARVRYQAAVQNRVLEEQLLSAEEKKFRLGASTTYNVVQQERDLANAQSTEVSALIAYSKSRVALDQTIGTILKSNNVSIDEATTGKVARNSALPEALPQ